MFIHILKKIFLLLIFMEKSLLIKKIQNLSHENLLIVRLRWNCHTKFDMFPFQILSHFTNFCNSR